VDNKELSYLSMISDTSEGKSLTVYYVPDEEGLALPKEVMRLYSSADFAARALWDVLNGFPIKQEVDVSHLELIKIDDLEVKIDQFLSKEIPNKIELSEDIPDELLDALRSSRFKQSNETFKRMANHFGWYEVKDKEEIDISDIGQYL
jgi:hypothetical protein